jgi:broad specificity phosphatase PhoE
MHLGASGVDLTHIFCSPLQRALVTAEQVRDAQAAEAQRDMLFVPDPALQEQDFGLFEGAAIRDYFTSDSRHASVETPEDMAKRADAFIDAHLAPLFRGRVGCTIGIVSHGCMLRVLWSQLLSKVVPRTVACGQETLTRGGSLDARNVVSWANTGFLEARFVRYSQPSDIVPLPSDRGLRATPSDGRDDDVGYDAEVLTINGRPHLEGFKKPRGGVGNARYDARQTSLRQYFGEASG